MPERSGTGLAAGAEPGRVPRLLARSIPALFVLFAVLQFVPGPRRGNPPLRPGAALEENLSANAEASALLHRACANCHSNRTAWPWYSRVAPVSWLVAIDVNTARQSMNLSEWPSDPFEAVALLKTACAQLRVRNMPPLPYRLMHPEARLSEGDVRSFCKWTEAAIPYLEARYLQQPVPAAGTAGTISRQTGASGM